MTLRPVALRSRVAFAAAAAILLAVVVLGGALVALIASQLRGSLDETLVARAGEVARLSASTPTLLSAPDALEGRLGGRQLLVQVIDARSRIVARSIALGGRVLPQGPAARSALERGERQFLDARLGPEPLRLFVAPLSLVGGGEARGGAVIIAASTTEVESTLAVVRRLVLLSALGAALLAAVLATALVRRALRPLSGLSSAARDIAATGDASRRLPAPHSPDEVGELGETLNAMLTSLERAREAERRFVDDASHELRTPLTALRGNAAYVARHGADPEALADLERDAARLARLLESLLALAREDAAGTPGEELRLDELVRAAAAAAAPRVTVGEAAPLVVRGDRVALERVLENLIENAHRHGPDEGSVEVSVARIGSSARLSVADEGEGPPHEVAERAFTRFWRAPGARREGSGLGLAIVRATAERHGGRASVEGSRFAVDLPLLRNLSGEAPRLHPEAANKGL